MSLGQISQIFLHKQTALSAGFTYYLQQVSDTGWTLCERPWNAFLIAQSHAETGFELPVCRVPQYFWTPSHTSLVAPRFPPATRELKTNYQQESDEINELFVRISWIHFMAALSHQHKTDRLRFLPSETSVIGTEAAISLILTHTVCSLTTALPNHTPRRNVWLYIFVSVSFFGKITF